MKTVSKEEYQRRVEQASPPSPVGKDCLLAFLFGGRHLHLGPGAVQPLPKPGPGAAPSPHRGVHQPDFPLRAAHRLGPLRQNRPARRGGHAGAHHGFANSMVSPALEFKSEGFVNGLGAKLFSIAGPVLVYGITASVVYGLVLFVWQWLGGSL